MPIKSVTPWLTTALLAALLGGCAGARKPAPTVASQEEPASEPEIESEAEAAEQAELNALMAEALDQAVLGRWEDLRLLCECQDGSAWAAAEIYGDGVAIWNNSTQFEIPRPDLLAALREVRRLGFAEMPRSFGGTKEPDEFALRVICRVSLRVDGASKEVVQFDKGEQSAELRQIAAGVFDACRKPAAAGISATSLDDALGKVASGRLAGQTLELSLNRKPDDASLQAGEPGFLLRVSGSRAALRPYRPGGFGVERTLDLTAAEIGALAGLLAQNEAGNLPVNLYAETYTDLTLRVLKWRKSVQARQFANMTPATHGDRQIQYDAIARGLERLAQEVADRGTPSEP